MGMFSQIFGKAWKAAKGEAKRTTKAKIRKAITRKCRTCGKRYSNPLKHVCRVEFKRAQARKKTTTKTAARKRRR